MASHRSAQRDGLPIRMHDKLRLEPGEQVAMACRCYADYPEAANCYSQNIPGLLTDSERDPSNDCGRILVIFIVIGLLAGLADY
jgi:hypothetical protein